MNSFLSYLGGKSIFSRQIVPMIPQHQCYCEVFAGAAWVLFSKPESKCEVINDINKELITLYRCIKIHLEEFVRYFKLVLISRDEFDRLMRVELDALTDIQRAARFYYLLRISFGAKIDSFSLINLLRLEEDLSDIHLRLSNVVIENLQYCELIDRYNEPFTFFYLDPPYWDCENFYGKGIFSKEDFIKLQSQLSTIKGKFMMSINDVPQIREIYKDFNIKEVQTRYSISSEPKNNVTELLIMNYDI
jgi:DNA adenine methylase